jgi:hypothetical protein
MKRQHLFFIMAAALLSGCATRIIAPQPLQEPREVFLLDHGLHPSLVLSRADGRMMRYSYGDWNYYARRKTGVWQAITALFVPTAAGLGRQELPGPSGEGIIRRQIRGEIEQILPLKVEAQAVEQLQAKLEAIYAENIDTLIYNAEFDADFVKHPKNYSLFHNSNQVVASWLESLGCEIRGWPILSKWRVESPVDEQTQATVPWENLIDSESRFF